MSSSIDKSEQWWKMTMAFDQKDPLESKTHGHKQNEQKTWNVYN